MPDIGLLGTEANMNNEPPNNAGQNRKAGRSDVALQITRRGGSGVYEVKTVIGGKAQTGRTLVITSPRNLAFPKREKESA